VPSSSQADVGSVEVLRCPPRPPADAHPRPSSVPCHYQALAHLRRRGSHPLQDSYSLPDPTKGVRVSVGVEGTRDCLPSPGEPTSLRLAHSGWWWGRRNHISCFPARELPSRVSPRARVRG